MDSIAILVITVGVVLVLLKIFGTFKYGQSIYESYAVAYLPLVVFVILGCVNPSWRGNESLVLFLIYLPMFASQILLLTMFPVVVAHVVLIIRIRKQSIKNERAKNSVGNIVIASFFIGGLLVMFVGVFFGIFNVVGFMLTTGACVYMIIRFIKRVIAGYRIVRSIPND